MKVDFTDTSTLTITPENGVENYALKKWFEGYTREGKSEESLHVNLFAELKKTEPSLGVAK